MKAVTGDNSQKKLVIGFNTNTAAVITVSTVSLVSFNRLVVAKQDFEYH